MVCGAIFPGASEQLTEVTYPVATSRGRIMSSMLKDFKGRFSGGLQGIESSTVSQDVTKTEGRNI